MTEKLLGGDQNPIILSSTDIDYVIALGSSASLAETPEKDNWV